MKYKSETEIMEELVESIFSGNVDSDDTEDEESEETTEKDTDTEEKDESKEDESEEEEEESEESDEGEESEESESDDNPDFGGKNSDGNSTGPFTSKIRSLQKQYNDLLVDAFEKYAPECIEDALDETESTFGENIEDILQTALDKLKAKIMDDLGVQGSSDIEGMEMPPEAMGGGFDPMAGADKPMEISIEKG